MGVVSYEVLFCHDLYTGSFGDIKMGGSVESVGLDLGAVRR